MTTRKVFRTAARPQAEPIEFAVVGVTENGDEVTETFRAKGVGNATMQTIYTSLLRFDANSEVLIDTSAVWRFFNVALLPDEPEKLERFVSREDIMVMFDDLVEIAKWIVQEWAGRPSLPSSH